MKPIDYHTKNKREQLGDEYGDFPDEQYMLLLQQGDYSVMKILIDRYKTYVQKRFEYAGIYNDVAEEMTHEIFIRILENRLSYMADKSRFKTWLTTIVTNLSHDHFRRRRTEKIFQASISRLNIVQEESTESYSQSTIDQLERAMTQLTHDQLTIIYLSKYKDYPYERIASMLKISISNVKVQVHRSITRLRNLYFEDENRA